MVIDMEKDVTKTTNILSTGQQVIGIMKKSDLIEQDKSRGVIRGNPSALDEYNIKQNDHLYIGEYKQFVYSVKQI